MTSKSKEVVVNEAKSVYASAQDVVKSGAYLYPFKVSSYHGEMHGLDHF